MPTRETRTIAAAALSTHRFLVRFANLAVAAFLWIFIFGYFVSSGMEMIDALAHTLLLYALAETTTLLATPLSMRFLRGSMIRGIVFGAALLALAYAYVGALAAGFFPHGASIVALLLGLSRALYRTPYRLERLALPPQRASLLPELALVATPALAGLLLSVGVPFPPLIAAAALVALMSLGFAALVPNVRESFEWTYRQTFAAFLHEGNAPLVYNAMLSGAKHAGLFLLWPLALFLAGAPTPASLGALFSAALLVILLVRLTESTPLVIIEIDGGSYVDEFTALKEMGRAFGAALLCCALAALVVLF